MKVYVFILLGIILYSCCGFEKDNSQNASSVCISKCVVDEDVVYPKGVIPAWVKDSLSEEGYALVCQLSKKYEMSYYPVSGYQTDDRMLENKKKEMNEKAIAWLLTASIEDNNALHETAPRLKSRSEGGNIGGGIIGGGGGGGSIGGGGHIGGSIGGSQSDRFDLCSQTHTFYKEPWGNCMMYVDVSAGYKYNITQKRAVEFRTINVNTDSYLLGFDIYWQDRSKMGEIINDGKKLSLHVDGRLKTRIEIEGLVGSDLVIKTINDTFIYNVEPGHTDDWLKKKK